jgi:hypothetical protein
MGAPPIDPLAGELPPLDRSGVPRDQWKRPLLYTRDGEGPFPYTSASTLGDTLQDDYGLNIWTRRMWIKGVGMDRELAAMAGASQYSTGFGAPDKGANREYGRELDQIGERGMDRAKAHQKRDWGSAVHGFTVDRDPLGDPPEEMEGDISAFWEALDNAGITIVDTEVFVANDGLMAAGSGDHLVEVPGRDKLVVLDKKTGVYHPESVPIQLAVYAGGDPYYVDDEHVHHRQTFLEKYGREVDTEYGLTAHLPAMEGKCFLYPENLVDGRDAAGHAIWVRAWHKRKAKNVPIDHEATARKGARDVMLAASYGDPTKEELRQALIAIHKQFKSVWDLELTEYGAKLIEEADQ